MENSVQKMRKALENSNELLAELAKIGEWGESAREQIDKLTVSANPIPSGLG